MISLAESLNQMASDRYFNLTDESRVEVHDVLDAAADYADGSLPIHEFAKVGTLAPRPGARPNAGYTRFVALMSTPFDDPRRGQLLRAIDAVLVFSGLVVTTQGVWTPQDLGEESAIGSMRVHPAVTRDPWEDAA